MPPTSQEESHHWCEIAGDTLFEFEGNPTNVASRKVVAIRLLVSLAKRQKAAGIPRAYRSAILATWDEAKANPGAHEIVRSYVVDPSRSLYVHGPVGVGKTWLACTIANELLQNGRTVPFRPVAGLLLKLRDTFKPESTLSELDLLGPLLEAEFLLLDELGDIALERERRASEFAASRLLTVLNERSQHERPTILTSNLSLAQLTRWAGDERLASRIRGVCGADGIIELAGRDLRCETEVSVGV